MEYWFEELNYAYSADDIEPGYVTLDKYLLTVPKEHFVSDKIEGEGGNVKWYGYDFDKQMPTSGGEYELDNLEERSGIDMWYNEEYGLLFDSQCGKEGKYVCCESNVGGTAFTCEFDTEEACQFKCENHCNILGHENNKLTFDAETGKYTCICSTKGRLAWEDYTLLNEKISICEFDKEEDCQEHCKSDCVMAGYEKDNLQWKESQGKYVCTCSEHTTGCPAYMYPHPESACAEDYVQRMDCKGLNEGCEYDEETQICTCPNGYNFQRSFYMGTTDNINCNELPPMFYHPNWQDWGGGSGQPSAYSPPVNKNAYYCIITNENRVVKVQWKSNQGEGGKFEWEYD
jgi:hypothetical protein